MPSVSSLLVRVVEKQTTGGDADAAKEKSTVTSAKKDSGAFDPFAQTMYDLQVTETVDEETGNTFEECCFVPKVVLDPKSDKAAAGNGPQEKYLLPLERSVVSRTRSSPSGSPGRVKPGVVKGKPTFTPRVGGVFFDSDPTTRQSRGTFAASLASTTSSPMSAAGSPSSATKRARRKREADSQASEIGQGLDRVLSEVKESLAKRHQVTIINRGTQKSGKSEFSVRLLTHILARATPSLEHALDIVADETAKAKQLQRLLNDDTGNNKDGSSVPKDAKEGYPPGARAGSVGSIPHLPIGGSQFTAKGLRSPPRKSFEGFTQTEGILHRMKERRATSPRTPSRPGTARSTSGRTFNGSPSRPMTARSGIDSTGEGGEARDNSPTRSRFALVHCSDRSPIETYDPNRPLLVSAEELNQMGSMGVIGVAAAAVGDFSASSLNVFSPHRPPSAQGGRRGRSIVEVLDPEAPLEGADGDEVDASRADTPEPHHPASPKAIAGGRRGSKAARLAGRRGSFRILEQLKEAVPEDAKEAKPPKNNGWRGQEPFGYYHFNGKDSLIQLPPLPKLPTLIREFTVDFWLRVDSGDQRQTIFYAGEGGRPDQGMQLHVARNWYSDMGETMRVFVRDSGNRILEAIFPAPTAKKGEWHHYWIAVVDLEEALVKVDVDGEPQDRVKIMQSEHPNSFPAPFSAPLFLGGFVDEENNFLHPLHGAILDLRFSTIASADGRGGIPKVRWPLVVDSHKLQLASQSTTGGGPRGNSSSLVEATKTIPEEANIVVQNCEAVSGLLHAASIQRKKLEADRNNTVFVAPESEGALDGIPKVAPLFDGNTVVNLGTLGPFGEFMHNFEFEIRFRTFEARRAMSLVGVTDAQHRMAELGIVLNAEPTMGNDRYRSREKNLTVFLVDHNGRCASGLVRVNDKIMLHDGRYHTLQWKVVDSESNKMECRIDHITHEVILMRREGPKSFLGLKDWVCLGGHNHRSYKLQPGANFSGIIKKFQLAVRGDPLVRLDLNEGPGAKFALDATHHGFHGIYLDGQTGAPNPNGLTWVPCIDDEKGPRGLMVLGEDGELDGIDGGPEIIYHKNNNVKYALVAFSAYTDPVLGTTSETILDCLHDDNQVELTLGANVLADQRFSLADQGSRQFYTLPESCFTIAEGVGQLKDELITGYEAALKRHKCHLAVVISLGDCNLTMVDIHGLRLPRNAVYDNHMLKWKSPVSLASLEDRTNHMLNRMVQAMDQGLLEVGSKPNLVRRLPPENLQPKQFASGLVEHLDYHGLPWRLAALTHGSLLSAELQTKLFDIYSVFSQTTEADAGSLYYATTARDRASEDVAAIMLQRKFRKVAAMSRRTELLRQRGQQQRKVDEVTSLRSFDTSVSPKATLKALVVTCFSFAEGSTLSPIDNRTELPDIMHHLNTLGYEVERLDSPTKDSLMRSLETINPTESTLVYILGYGGQVPCQKPPLIAWDRLVVQYDESYLRVMMSAAFTEKLACWRVELDQGVIAITSALEAALGKKKRKKKEQARPMTRSMLAAAEKAKKAKDEIDRVENETLQQTEADARFMLLSREYETEISLMFVEFKRATTQWRHYEGINQEQSVVSLFTQECKTHVPFPGQLLTLEEMRKVALRLAPTAPQGMQSMLIVDLMPPARQRKGHCYLGASTGYEVQYTLPRGVERVVSWHLRKALQGYATPIPKKRQEPSLFGGVDFSGGENKRDWRCTAHYLSKKVEDALWRHAQANHYAMPKDYASQLPKYFEEKPFVTDLVPIREIIATPEVKETQHKANEMRRVAGTVFIGVEIHGIGHDVLSDCRLNIGEFSITDLVTTPSVIYQVEDDNAKMSALSMGYIRQEVKKCIAPASSIEATIKLTSKGLVVELVGGERAAISQSLSALNSKYTQWRIPLTTHNISVGVLSAEQVHLVKGSCGNWKRWKVLLKKLRESPQLTSQLRLLAVQND